MHSIVPYDAIFNRDASPGQTFELIYLGERVQVTHTAENRLVITRLLSTSPRSYLNPKFTPGNIVDSLM